MTKRQLKELSEAMWHATEAAHKTRVIYLTTRLACGQEVDTHFDNE